jgi:hypothetical protein
MQGKQTRTGGEDLLRTETMAQIRAPSDQKRTCEHPFNTAARHAAIVTVVLGIPSLIVIPAVTAMTSHFGNLRELIRHVEGNLLVPAALIGVTAFVSGLYACLNNRRLAAKEEILRMMDDVHGESAEHLK